MTTNDTRIYVPATYQTTWNDGFGARGWKIDAALDDPLVIASTAETGNHIPTSVFVHDILDHHLCGLKLSGHRNEAVALTMLGERTGTSPVPDFTQMVEEDILRGNITGEAMRDFLPDALLNTVPKHLHRDNKLLIGFLLGALGESALKPLLVGTFVSLGRAGYPAAKSFWQQSGLDFSRRRAIGLCVQQLLEQFDAQCAPNIDCGVQGEFMLSNRHCELRTGTGETFVADVDTDTSH